MQSAPYPSQKTIFIGGKKPSPVMGGLLNHCFTYIIHVINEGSDEGLSTIYHRWVGQSPKLKRELVDEHFTGRYHRLRGYLALPPV
jgi:hypothetical protein